MLSLANFSNNAILRTRSLKALQSGIQRLVLTNANFCHLHFPPFATTAEANLPPGSFTRFPIYTTSFRIRNLGIHSIRLIKAKTFLQCNLLYHIFPHLSSFFSVNFKQFIRIFYNKIPFISAIYGKPFQKRVNLYILQKITSNCYFTTKLTNFLGT